MKKNIITNINVILKVLDKKYTKIEKIYILKTNKKVEYVYKKAKKHAIEVVFIKEIKDIKLKYIKKYTYIICKIRTSIEELNIEKLLEKEIYKNILILDRIQDPHNLAACLRTAEAFNFKLIIINEQKFNDKTNLTTNISNGANLNLKILKEKNLLKIISLLKEKKIEVIGLSKKAKTNINDIKINKNICIIIGSEKNGINKNIKKECTTLVKINTHDNNSLNLSVTTGIILSKIYN